MKRQRRLRLSAFIVICLFSGFLANPAAADDWDPWEVTETNRPQASRPEINPLDQAVRNFQKYISPLDGARCPMYPTCSAYARQALHKHGPLLGIFMTVDRLLHEGDPSEQQEPVIKWGYRRYFDPLEYNDFWLQQ